MTPLVFAVLTAAILTAWIEARWAWSAAQAALLALVAVRVWVRPEVPPPVVWFPLAAAAWGMAQSFAGVSIYPWVTRDVAFGWLSWAAAAWLGHGIEPRRVVPWLTAFGGLLAAAALLGEYTAPGKHFWFWDSGYPNLVMGPFVYGNQYAAFVQLALPAALVTPGPAGVLAAAALVVSALISGSVAGFTLAFVEAAAVLALRVHRREIAPGHVGRVVGGMAALTAAFALVTGWDTFAAKVWTRPESAAHRMEMNQASARMFQDRPVLGFGLGTWNLAYPPYARFDNGSFENQAHNDWAQWAVEGGAPFLALMLAMAAVIARPAWRTLWGIGLISVLLHCLLEYHFQQRPQFGCLYFALAGAVTAAGARERREPV